MAAVWVQGGAEMGLQGMLSRGVGTAALAVCAVATIRQIGVWKSTETVWSRVIEIKPSGRAYKERDFYRWGAMLKPLLSSVRHWACAGMEACIFVRAKLWKVWGVQTRQQTISGVQELMREL